MKIKKISKSTMDQMISDKVQALYGKADPEIVKQLSEILQREVASNKDTEDYNMDLVSEIVDKYAKVLMEAGADSLKSGEVLKLDSADIDVVASYDLLNSITNSEYDKYPFNHALEKEMRAYFLLKTSKSDTFKDLIHEFETLAPNFMEPEHLDVFKEVVKETAKRLFKEPLMFLNPPEGTEQGSLRKMKDKEKSDFGLVPFGEISVDERMDNHDLLSLKELVSLMKGSEAHPLTIGPGFFSKYMPELAQKGIKGVACEVRDKKLVKIHFLTPPSYHLDKESYDVFWDGMADYGPLLASSLTFYSLLSREVKSKNEKLSEGEFSYGFYVVNKKFWDNCSLYVTVDSTISGPSKLDNIGYQKSNVNDKKIKAAETFLFKKEKTENSSEEEFTNTRIYFYAHNPTNIHPIMQHGSVSFGLNDMSYHSCRKTDTPDGDLFVEQFYKEWVKERAEAGKTYSPADLAALLHYFPKGKGGKESIPTDMFLPENKKAMQLSASGVTDHNNGSYWNMMRSLSSFAYAPYFDNHASYTIDLLMQKEYPLTHRWMVSEYIKNDNGIQSDPTMTFYRKLVMAVEAKELKQMMELYLNLNKK